MGRSRISQKLGMSGLKLTDPRWPLLEKEWKPPHAAGRDLLNGTDWVKRYSYQPEAKIRPSYRMAHVCLVCCSPVLGFKKT